MCVFRAWVLRLFSDSFSVCCSEYELRQWRENACRRDFDPCGIPAVKSWDSDRSCLAVQSHSLDKLVAMEGPVCCCLEPHICRVSERMSLVNGWDSVIG